MIAPPEDVLDMLAAYALDALEPKEIGRVSELLQEQPELYDTLTDLRVTVQQLPIALPEAEPASDLRQRTLDYATGRAVRPFSHAVSSPAPNLRRWIWGLVGALAVAIVAGVGGWSQYVRTATALAQMQQTLATIQLNQQQAAATISQSSALVELRGDTGHGTILRTTGGATVLATNLPPLPSGRVYQLWLIQGNSAPVSGGLFTVDPQGSGLIVFQSDAQFASGTFAVTNEPVGGSVGPTTPVLIAGKAPVI